MRYKEVKEAFILACVREERETNPRAGTVKVLEAIKPKLAKTDALLGCNKLNPLPKKYNRLVEKRTFSVQRRRSRSVAFGLAEPRQGHKADKVQLGREVLAALGRLSSMTEEPYCHETAMAERLNGILKGEYDLDCRFRTRAEVIAR